MLLAAHRGASAYEPENTLRAFQKGADLGANAVELDVRRTKDGAIVAIHDAKVNRTTNGRGKAADLTLEEIKRLDAGKGEKIPTLKEAVEWAKGKATLLVEFKESGFETEAAGILRESPGAVAISFMPDVLRKLRSADPKITTGLLFKKRPKDPKAFLSSAKELGVNWILGRSRTVRPELIGLAHPAGFKVLVWTVNRLRVMRKWKELGADGITSDRPDLFRKL